MIRKLPFPLALLLVAPFAWAQEGPTEGAPPAAGTPAPAAAVPGTAAPAPGAAVRRTRRHHAAARAGPDAVLLVLAAGPSSGFTGKKRSDDFHYVSPTAAANAAVVVFHESTEDGESVVRHRLYLPARMPAMERWSGALPGPGAETAARFLFDDVPAIERLAPDLAGLLGETGTLLVSATAPADGRERLDKLLGRVAEHLPAGVALTRQDGRRRQPPGAATPPKPTGPVVRSARSILGPLRATKSAQEIDHIRKAVEATVDGILDALRLARPDMPEYQLQAVVELRCRLAGCPTQAFDSIIGSGPNSCVLHYKDNRRTMRAGDIVVMDVGGEYLGYAADVTRSFPVSGKFTDEQAKVYDAVLAAQEAGLAAVKPGATIGEVHAAAKAVLTEHGLAQYFFHGTSHSVGLNVHDVWSRPWKLRPGAVLTVEPGAYIADKSLGIRIEDTVVVTEDGCEILSARAPKTRAEIEALMAEAPPLDVR